MGRDRLLSLDFFKACFITSISVDHLFSFWSEPSSYWLFAITTEILQTAGTPAFTFAAGFGLAYSWFGKTEKKKDTTKEYITSFSKSLALFLWSMLLNFIYWHSKSFSYTALFTLFVSNVVQTISLARMLGLLFIKAKIRVKLLITVAVFIIGQLGNNFLTQNSETNQIYNVLFIIFFRSPENLVIYLPSFISGMILGEKIYEYRYKRDYDMNTLRRKYQSLIFVSLGILIFSLVVGLERAGNETYPNAYTLIEWLQTHPALSDLDSVPLIFIRLTYPYVIHSLGMNMIFFTICYYYMDFRNIQHLKIKKTVNWINIFGYYTLTIYTFQWYIWSIPIEFSYKTIVIPTMVFCAGLSVVIYLIHFRTNGKLSAEYCIEKLGKLFNQKLTNWFLPYNYHSNLSSHRI